MRYFLGYEGLGVTGTISSGPRAARDGAVVGARGVLSAPADVLRVWLSGMVVRCCCRTAGRCLLGLRSDGLPWCAGARRPSSAVRRHHGRCRSGALACLPVDAVSCVL